MTKYKQTNKTKALLAGTDSARKRDFYFSTLTNNIVNTASYWSGGSRDYYSVINIDTPIYFTPPAGSYPNFNAEYTMKPGDVLIHTGIFMGKPATPYFSCLAPDEQRVRQLLGLAETRAEAVAVTQPIVPLGFASYNPETGETTIRTKI